MTPQPPEAGWYPDNDQGYVRWWDGAKWTDARRAADSPGRPVAARRRFFPPGDEPFYKWVRIFQGVGLGGIALVLILMVAALPLMLLAPLALWILRGVTIAYMLAVLGIAIKVYVEGKSHRE